MTSLGGRLALSRRRRPARRSAVEWAAPPLLGLAAIATAFAATERLSDQSPLVAVGLALLVVLPGWMVFSANYRLTLTALLLYLGLVDGVLKLMLNTSTATLGRDVLLYSIVAGALARIALDARPVRLPPLSGYVLAFVAVVLVQVFNPSTDGIVRGLAATRPHLEFVPLFFFGYVLMREQRHLRVFLLLVCVIAAVNGVVSLIQFNLAPAQLAAWGPGYAELIQGTGDVSGRIFYDEASGGSFLRPFGLGADTGFAGFVGVLGVPAVLALIATANRRWAGRLGAPLAIGIILAVATSQTRSAVVAAVVALVAFAAFALASGRRALALAGVAALLAVAVGVTSSLSGSDNSAALDRYDSISPTSVLGATRESRGGSLGLLPAYAEQFPLGAGLGQVGPASSFGTRIAGDQPLSGETEFNFLVVELGIIGLLVFLALQLRLLALSARLRRVADPETRLLLAGCAAPLFAIAASWIAGPVSAGTPLSPFFWFVAGVLAFWLARPTGAPNRPATPPAAAVASQGGERLADDVTTQGPEARKIVPLSCGPPDSAIAVCSTLGSGSHDEDRIISLTAALNPTVWSFDRANKRRAAGTLLRRLRRERPDLVVIEGTAVAAGLAALIGRFVYGVPYVVSSGDAVGPFIRLIAPRLRLAGYLYEFVLCRFCAGFIGWSPYLAGRAMTLGAPRAMTAANWAPPQTSSPADRAAVRRALGIAPDAIVFGLAGSLNWSEHAGYCYGLELVRAIRRTARSDVHVVLVGDGDGLPRLEKEAGAELGVRVHCTGRVPREQLGRYFAAIDVASLPQSVDGVGAFRYTTKLSEYLAAGLPVVTGQLPFAYDLGGDGWLWRLPGDMPWSETYVAALAALMTQVVASDVQQRRASVPHELPLFDEELQRRRVTAFLGDVLERNRPRARG